MPFAPSYDVTPGVQLIKSPSLNVAGPEPFPSEVHPLPPDLHAYFVYPFSLEYYVQAPGNPKAENVEQLRTKHKEFLRQRTEEQHKKEADRLKRVAPGWTSGASLLQPTTRTAGGAAASPPIEADKPGKAAESTGAGHEDVVSSDGHHIDAMAQLVDHLDNLNTTQSG
ncbi:unnamed protein product [Jaminaea pallidilutea]